METSCTFDLMFNWFFKILFLLTVVACSTRGPVNASENPSVNSTMPQKVLLLIPGFYGSKLIEKSSGETRWAQLSNFIFSQTGLSQRIPGTIIGDVNPMEVDGLLKSVTIFPGLYTVDSYGKTIDQLSQFAIDNQMRFETVAYDWREDVSYCLKTIDEKIKSLKLNPEDELYIVGHSMGAMLMAYYIRYGAQEVESAVENWAGLKQIKRVALIAPPLHGLMILFRDIEDGTSVGLNRTLLSGHDYSTFKSSYSFLPPKGEDVALSENGEKIVLNIHNIDNWVKNKWGPFKFAKPSEVKSVYAFVKINMFRMEKFHELLRAPIAIPPPKKLPLLQMKGHGHKTKEYASIKIKDNLVTYSFNKEGEVDGDGTVTNKSGVPLEYFKSLDFSIIDSELGHLDMLALPESQKLIQNFLKK